MKVHLVYKPEGKALKIFQEKLDPGIEMSYGSEIEDSAVEILVAGRPEREMIESCDQLQSLIIPWAGIPTKTQNLMADYPQITVHNLHHNAVPTAELAVALMLAAAKRIRVYDQKLRKGNWELRYKADQSVLLEGRQALIVGYGAIGRRVGDVLLALGLQVTGFRRNPLRAETGRIPILAPSQLKGLLPGADILILTLPLTPETRGLIGAEELKMLPENSIIVNVSRGPIIDQEALYHALKNERIHGAGLDVWYNYPKTKEERLQTFPGDFPFHELNNVVMSPHRGGKSPEVESARMEALAASLNAAKRGDGLPNQVDIDLGY